MMLPAACRIVFGRHGHEPINLHPTGRVRVPIVGGNALLLLLPLPLHLRMGGVVGLLDQPRQLSGRRCAEYLRSNGCSLCVKLGRSRELFGGESGEQLRAVPFLLRSPGLGGLLEGDLMAAQLILLVLGALLPPGLLLLLLLRVREGLLACLHLLNLQVCGCLLPSSRLRKIIGP